MKTTSPEAHATMAPAPFSASGAPEFDYAAGQPNLYRIMCFKQELCAKAGVREAFDVFKARFGWPPGAELERLPLESMLAYARAHAAPFHETAPAGERFSHQPPSVIGPGNHRVVAGVTRTQYVARLESAVLRGRSAVVRVGPRLLLDIEGDEPTRVDDELEWDPAVFRAGDGHAWYIPAVDEERPLRVAEAFSLLGAHTDFFGHWMCEYLPKFVAARLGGLPQSVPVLIDSHMPASHRASLELLYPGLALVEVPAFRSVRADRLWVAPTLNYMPLHEVRNEKFDWDHFTPSPDRFRPVLEEMSRRAPSQEGGPGGPERVFLARKGFRHRKLVNAAEIEAIAREHGFQVCYPEDHSFAEQVRLIGGARQILASEGSAIFLAFFARPGSRLLILSHPLTDALADYNGILATRQVSVSVLTGPFARWNDETPHDSDYSIDPLQFKSAIADRLQV